MTEQGFLRISIGVTILCAAFGIAVGLLSGSFAIVFDGIYSLTDASMTILALWVSKLIVASASGQPARSSLGERFTVGFWHLEPMVLGLNGTLLMGAAIFALVSAIDSLMTGGRVVDFGPAMLFAAVTVAVALGMAFFAKRANRTIKSDFVALDGRAWLMSAALTAALLVAFVFGFLIRGTSFEWLVPFVDPFVLAVVCLVIIPMPVATIRQALADVMLVAPVELREHVDRVAADIVQRHGFTGYRAYVARVGRGKQIELFFIAPAGGAPKKLSEWDALRDEIGEAIGDEGPDRWLTIVFTEDPEWAD